MKRKVQQLLVGGSPFAAGKPCQGARGPFCQAAPEKEARTPLPWTAPFLPLCPSPEAGDGEISHPSSSWIHPREGPGAQGHRGGGEGRLCPARQPEGGSQGRNEPLARHAMEENPGRGAHHTTLYGRAQADEIFQQLEKEVEYFEGEFTKLHIFGNWHEIPRKQVTYGDAGLTYTYSGVTFSPKPWIPILNRIRDRVQLVTTHTFNFVLINRYKDGHDHMGEHRDDEKELVPHSPIASVSFGACRDFIFRHGASRGKIASRRIAPVKLQLGHGSLLMMNYPTNQYWYHSLPRCKKVLAPRINLTFRKVRTL